MVKERQTIRVNAVQIVAYNISLLGLVKKSVFDFVELLVIDILPHKSSIHGLQQFATNPKVAIS
jgi:hypothetical protein